MKKATTIGLALCLAAGAALGQAKYDAKEIQDHVNYLASDARTGRFTGSDGARQAGDYIRDSFKRYGLKPAFGGDYFQNFQFVSELEMTKKNSLQLSQQNRNLELAPGTDFTTAPFSGAARFTGEVIFVGYGISAEDLGYDDYAGIDVTGKAVLIMRYHPEYDNPHSQFEKYASYRFKAKSALDRGAKAVLFVTGHQPSDPGDKLMVLRHDQAGAIRSLAVAHIKRSVADRLFAGMEIDFAALQQRITTTKTPQSMLLKETRVVIETEIREVEKTGRNVSAVLTGTNNKDEFIVIGAHYDHLGLGSSGSLYRGDEVLIHNGADDNASGTAGLLALARQFSRAADPVGRSLLFVAFSGEELGLLGSSHFVKDPPMATDKMVAMVNMDMIGRLNDENKLVVYGTGTSEKWEDILNTLNQEAGFDLTFHKEGFGPSDHSSFYGKEIPVLHFFTGTHPDYHRPSDDADKINTAGMANVLSYVHGVIQAIDGADTRPVYVNVPQQQRSRRGFRVSVGTIPDYSENVEGLKISGVTKGGAAEKAGLKGGDVIVSFGGKEITNIYDYTYALQDATPGQVVDVVVIRNEERLTFKVELGAR